MLATKAMAKDTARALAAMADLPPARLSKEKGTVEKMAEKVLADDATAKAKEKEKGSVPSSTKATVLHSFLAPANLT